MRKMTVLFAAVGLMVAVAAAQPALAACSNARIISSFDLVGGSFSYVFTPGCTPGDNCDTSVSPSFRGNFWALGSGDPATGGAGDDNGSFPADGWLLVYSGYPTSLNTSWAADGRIDNCIDNNPPGSKCTVMFLSDTNPVTGDGVFAYLTAGADASANYNFAQPANGPINLVPVPKLAIGNSTRQGDTGVTIEVVGPSQVDLDAGMYLSADPQCNSGGGGAELFEGYRVRAQVLARGSAPPSDFNVENWPPAPAPGGGGVGSTPIGQNTTVALPCGQDSDVYLSYTLVGKGCSSADCFNTEIVFQTSTRVECGANLADPEERIQVKPLAQPRKKTTKR